MSLFVSSASAAGTAPVVSVTEAGIARMFGAPPDWPLMAVALSRLAEACNALQMYQFGPCGTALSESVTLLAESTPVRQQDLGLIMDGRRAQYPVWTKLVTTTGLSGLAYRLLAAEFGLALISGRPVRRCVIDRMTTISAEPRTSDQAYVERLVGDLREHFTQRSAGISPSTLWLNSRVLACIAAEMRAYASERQQGVAGARTLPAPLAQEIGRWLYAQDDVQSAALIAAFLTGLTWDVSKNLPFGPAELNARHVGLVDTARGLIQIDLRPLMPQTARRDGCVSTTWVVRRPIPQRTTELLRRARARNPAASCLADLLQQSSNRQRIGSFGTAATYSRFLASRGLVGLEAGLDRKVAAYCTGALSLMGRSEHHYVLIRNDELQNAFQQLFAWLGWSVNHVETHSSTPLGAPVTPTDDVVLQLEKHHRRTVETQRVGRRASLHSLLRFHASYAVFCAHRTAFCTLARAAKHYAFDASSLSPLNEFGTLVDKRTDLLRCATPIPLPVSLRHQLALWLRHLESLDRRLAKLGWPQCTQARERIRAALDLESSPLFFTILPDGRVHIPGSIDVFRGTDLKGDAYRHYVPNRLRQLGVSAEVIEAMCRHIAPHSTVLSAASPQAPRAWLRESAAALDLLAAELDMSPVHGLRKDV